MSASKPIPSSDDSEPPVKPDPEPEKPVRYGLTPLGPVYASFVILFVSVSGFFSLLRAISRLLHWMAGG